ncbi:MAG TPA: hypothetical protein GX711_05155, partial [Clostridia bacterium]|nr:hypothetical protein [Clostridia bacterium]
MKKLIVSCRALAPLCLREGREKDAQKSLEYIPGTSWRGALAWIHTLVRPGEDREFQEFFVSGKVRYPHLLPADFSN